MNTTAVPPLTDKEVHVWDFSLELSAAGLKTLASSLTPLEQTRAAAFHFPRDANHFIAARGRLRQRLAHYLGADPAALCLVADPNGKPRLAGDFADAGLHFNLSHSHGRAMIAVTRGCEVGIDLEMLRPEVDCSGIVASQFSALERGAWATLAEADQRDAFFRAWVRKEAYVKARGDGFSRDPSVYTVALGPDAKSLLLDDSLDRRAAGRWMIELLPTHAGFAAAVAYQMPERSLCISKD